MAKRCKAELEGLGFTVRFDDSAERTGSDTGNLIAFRAGSAAGAVALCGHMDTVRPCKGIEPVVEDGVIRSAGGGVPSSLPTIRLAWPPSSRVFAASSKQGRRFRMCMSS